MTDTFIPSNYINPSFPWFLTKPSKGTPTAIYTSVPVGQASPLTPSAQLTDAGNVPIGQAKTAPTDTDVITGLGIERTASTQATKAPGAETKPTTVEAKTSTEGEKPFKKTGESVDERLTRYYISYKNATPEEKEKLLDKYITKHYDTLKNKPKAEQIKIQLEDYEKLLSNTRNPDSREMITRKINVLKQENQVPAAKRATVEETDPELKKRGEIGVAKTIHKCADENQTKLTQLVVDSKNVEAITIGATNASKLAKENQPVAAKIYEGTKVSEDPEKAEAFQKSVDKILIDQYGQFAEENQLPIHQIMSDSKFSETVEYAAKNIYHFDKANQADAFQITVNTGNKEAINAASEQWGKYDNSAKDEIKTIINETKYDIAKEIIVKAQAEALEAKIKANEKEEALAAAAEIEEAAEQAEEKQAQSANISSASTDEAQSTDQTIAEIEKAVNSNEDPTALINNLSDVEQIALLQQCPSDTIIRAIINSDPSRDVLGKIPPEYLAKIGSKGIGSNLTFVNASAQLALVNSTSDLTTINRAFLLSSVKIEYDKLLQKQEKNIATNVA